MKIRLRDISIRSKLILMQVFTSLLVLSLVFTVFVITDIRSYKERKVKSMTSLAHVVSTNAVSTIEFQDQDVAKEILSELHKTNPEIVQAVIVDSSGKLFAAFRESEVDSFQIPPGLKENQTFFSGTNLYVSSPIIGENKINLGNVYLNLELTELENIKRSKYQIATILLIIAIAFSFLVAILVQRYISKRLLNLVDTMKDVGQTGYYHKAIEDDGKDEISTLAQVYNDLMEKIRENQKKKDEFIGIASHELKTPITSIKGYLELLKKMEDRQPHQQFVTKAWENVNKLVRLVNDLLDVSKIQSGQLELNIQEFNIAELLDEVIGGFHVVSGSHQIIREDELTTETISADKQRIEQVLTNLLSNAIKYSPGESKVIVYSDLTEKELVVRIRDMGIGIAKEERTNVFERFYRTKDISAHISGFGLGLYICSDIIIRHGGRIWVEAEEKGSSFYFALPRKEKVATNHRPVESVKESV